MKTSEERTGLLGDYFGFDSRTLVTFFCLVVGVLVVVTGIYVAIFGFENWRSSMSQAGSMMLSNFDNPNGAITPTPGGTPAAAQSGAQYICPNCGTSALPLWSQKGTPLCPNCGTVMGVSGPVSGRANLAAAP